MTVLAQLAGMAADGPERLYMPRPYHWRGLPLSIPPQRGIRPGDSTRSHRAKRRTINRYQERAGKVEACRA